jgi:hypothetical protein
MTIACTLTPDQIAARRGALAGLDVVEARVTGRVAVPRDARNEAALADFVRAEQECCPFFDLSVTADGDLLVLTIAGPPDAEPLIVELVGMMYAGDRPPAADRGLGAV